MAAVTAFGHNSNIHFIDIYKFNSVIAGIIIIEDFHFRRIGEIKQLPRQFHFYIISALGKIGKRVKVGRIRVGVSVSQLSGFK